MKYIKRFNENMDMAKSIISKKMLGFDRLKDLLKSNLGYIGKFTDYLMNENIPFEELSETYERLINLKKKQKSIDINVLSYEKLIDNIIISENEISVTSIVNLFPREQKDIAKTLISKSSNNKNLFLQLSNSDKIDRFISKISRYKSEVDLLNAVKIFSKNADNSREFVINFTNNSKNSEILVDNENILIVKVTSIEDIKVLGSDTSWCILGKSMWDSYTKGRHQYVLYNWTASEYDTLFKIGFTLNPSGTIHAVHDIIDKPCDDYLRALLKNNNIELYSLININKIDISDDVINSIRPRTTIAKLSDIFNNISRDKIPKLVKKLMEDFDSFKTGTLSYEKRRLFTDLVKSYFDTEYFTDDDLNDIYTGLDKISSSSYSSLSRKVIYKDRVPTLNSDILKIGVDHWTDDAIRQISPTYVSSIISVVSGIICDKNDLLKLKNRIESINDKPVNLKTVYVLICHALDLNYDKKLLNEPNVQMGLLSWSRLYDFKIDLSISNFSSLCNTGIVDKIIKKDYKSEYYIDYYKANYVNKLIEHLKGYEINFIINKSDIKNILNINKNELTNLKPILSKFNRIIRSSDVVTSDDGKVKITAR